MANDFGLPHSSSSNSQAGTPALSRAGRQVSSSLEHCRSLMEQLREGLRSFRLPSFDADDSDRVNFEGRWCVMHACLRSASACASTGTCALPKTSSFQAPELATAGC